jgi:integrase
VKAKGGKDQTYYFSPKTGDAVAAWLTFRAKNCEHDRLFCHGPRRPISDEYVRGIIAKYANEVGIEDHRGILPHAQKHLVGCRLIEQGVDIMTISQRLAHARPTTTLQHYLHANDEKVKESRNVGLETVVKTSNEKATGAGKPSRPRRTQRPVEKPQVSKSVAKQLLDKLMIKMPTNTAKAAKLRR